LKVVKSFIVFNPNLIKSKKIFGFNLFILLSLLQLWIFWLI